MDTSSLPQWRHNVGIKQDYHRVSFVLALSMPSPPFQSHSLIQIKRTQCKLWEQHVRKLIALSSRVISLTFPPSFAALTIVHKYGHANDRAITNMRQAHCVWGFAHVYMRTSCPPRCWKFAVILQSAIQSSDTMNLNNSNSNHHFQASHWPISLLTGSIILAACLHLDCWKAPFRLLQMVC